MNYKTLIFQIEPEDDGCRLDRCLTRLIPSVSRTFLQQLIRDGLVSIDEKTVSAPRHPVQSGMRIVVDLPQEEALEPVPEPFDFPILYEDNMLLVINKPAGVVVHPAAGNPTGTVVNAFLGRYPHLNDQLSGNGQRPGIVHRLDKDTSGCLILAKTTSSQFKLSRAFADRKTHKVYLAIVKGIPPHQTDEIRTLIGRHPVNRQKMAIVNRNGKPAITRYRVQFSGMLDAMPVSVVLVQILTGRTHQIRVHLASIGTPVLGDSVYGGTRMPVTGIERQLLHAWKLRFPHPTTGSPMKLTAPIPDDIQNVLNRIHAPAPEVPAEFD